MNKEEAKAKAETLEEVALAQALVEQARMNKGHNEPGTTLLVAAVIEFKANNPPETSWQDAAQRIASAATAACWMVWGVEEQLKKETKQ